MSEENKNTETIDDTTIREIIKTINDFSKKHPKIALIITLILAFFIGFGIGKIGTVNKDIYNSVLSAYESTKASYDWIETTYSEYKEKMQPYEAQQELDAKAAEEAKAKKEAEEKSKKEAEEKAKKEAEEKAKREAEEKAKKDTAEKAAQAKLQSLGGITATDFYNSFNDITASNGYDAFLGKSNRTNNLISYTTLNPDIAMRITTDNNNYLQTVAINAKRTTSESLTEASYYMLATALVIDPTLSNDSVDSLLMTALQGAIANAGQDCKVSNNGIDYTINVTDSIVSVFYSRSM